MFTQTMLTGASGVDGLSIPGDQARSQMDGYGGTAVSYTLEASIGRSQESVNFEIKWLSMVAEDIAELFASGKIERLTKSGGAAALLFSHC